MAGAKAFTVYTDMRVLQRLIKNCSGKPVRILHDGVDYGIYQEFGFTHHISGKSVPAHPFMTPAIEGVRSEFLEGWKQVTHLEQGEEWVELCARRAEGIAKAHAPVDTGALRASIAISKPEDFEQ